MNTQWTWAARVGVLLLMLVGCKSSTPDLKPAKQPEVFNPPSSNANLASYPKQAFANPDDGPKRNPTNPNGMGPNSMMPANFNGPQPPGGGLR
jgi:hypothetical protein